ncbi:hypothetical protein SLE2022_128250 [Rubroshorea leprosula]
MRIKNKAVLFLLLCISEFLLGTAVTANEWKLGTVIGIDLGATYSRVGVFKKGHVQIIANDEGNRTTPSWVAFTDNGPLIGEAAKNQAPLNAERTIFNVNCLIGKMFDDTDVQREITFLPYKVVNKEGKPYIQVTVKGEIKVFSPEEITAMILTKIKEKAEMHLGKKIKDAIIAVPTYFSDAQRQATKNAATIAGFNVVKIINKTVAAAIAYGLGNNVEEKNILVYDLGGSTFDVSILNIDNGMFFYLATSGDTHLGGKDFDHRVTDYFIRLIKKKHNKDISKDNGALVKLRKECERAKRLLSGEHQVQVEIESLFDGINFSEPLTRGRFEELNMDLFKKTLGPVKRVLEDAGLKKTDIHEIVPAGGSTRIPKVQLLLEEMFDGKEPLKGINPDEAVAYGAAVQGGILSGEGSEYAEVPFSFAFTPFSLGVETVDGVMIKLIPKGLLAPVKKSHIFTTYQDQQTTISIKVLRLECERSLTKDYCEFGRYDLTGIPPAPMGVSQIEVTFEFDVEGFCVTAVDKTTKYSQSITVTYTGRPFDEEVEMMVKEAKESAE